MVGTSYKLAPAGALSGFSVRQLEQSGQFYRMYPIGNALRSQLNWTQCRLLIQIEDPFSLLNK